MPEKPKTGFQGFIEQSRDKFLEAWKKAIGDISGVKPEDQVSFGQIAVTGITGPLFGELAKQEGVAGLLDNVWGWITGGGSRNSEGAATYMIEKMIEVGILPSEMKDSFTRTIENLGALSPIAMIFAGVLIFKEYVGTYMSVTGKILQANIAENIRPFLPSSGEIMNAAFRDPGETANVRKVLARSGIPEKYIDLVFKAQYNSYDVGTVRDLFLRGEIDKQKVYERMRALHFSDELTTEIMKTWNVLPGPGDLIRFAVREAFSPDQVAALDLDANFPPTLMEWASKIGISTEVAKLFWRAHWNLPSPSQGYEMLHRGKITNEQLSALLTALDFAPVWHDKLQAISYNVVTRVDARRLYDVGTWDEERLEKAYNEMGYSPDDAKDLVNWTKKEYGQEDKEASLAQVLEAQIAMIISQEEAKELILKLGYSEERSNWLLSLNQFKMEAKERQTLIETEHIYFQNGIHDETIVRGELGNHRVSPEFISQLVEKWTIEKLVARKMPSKSDYDKFLKKGIISTGEYHIGLRNLGYTDEQIGWYTQLNERSEA